MSTSQVRRLPRLALFVGCASLLISVAVANAQDWSGYPPPGAYPPGADASYYGPPPGAYQGPYAPGSYAAYAQGAYAQDPYAHPYDPYAAQRRARRRRMAQQQDQAYAAPPSAPQAYVAPVQQPAPAAPPADAPSLPANAPPVAAPLLVAAATAPAPALPAAPKTVALAHQIVDSASAYLAYMRKASAISAAFTDGAGVAKEVRTGAGYEAKQFEEGAIAYAAIMALQEPAFIDGVRAVAGGDPGRTEQMAGELIANPAIVTTFPGSDAAIARAALALRRQGNRLMEAGSKVKQAAYDVQHSAWSKNDVAEPEVRLAKAKTLSSTRVSLDRDETDKLLKVALADQGASGGYGGSSSPVVNRGLALAALAVLGQAGEGAADRVTPLLAEEHGGECLKMAKLNLFQCLAVAGPHYEDIFCLGQHAMMDTAQCVIKASGATPPVMTAQAAAPVTQQVAEVSRAPQDYWVQLGGGGAAQK